jgi:Mn-dependent DtxR family transcriptional regulator
MTTNESAADEAKRLARSWAPEEVEALFDVMRNPHSPPETKRQAATTLLAVGGVYPTSGS